MSTTTVERTQTAQDRYGEAQIALRTLQAQRKAAPASYNEAVKKADSAAMIAAKREIQGLDEEVAAQIITVATLHIDALEEQQAEVHELAHGDTVRQELETAIAERTAAKDAADAAERRYMLVSGNQQAYARHETDLEGQLRDARARREQLIAGQLLAV
jgi:hypothetical protein